MPKQNILTGSYHNVPQDLKNLLLAKKNILQIWNSLTPIARNEWICWVTIVKQEKSILIG